MRKTFMVVLAMLFTLTVFAQQRKPTPTAVAKRPAEAKLAPAPVKPTPAPLEGKPTKDQLELTGKVISTSGNTFTVESNGKQVTFSSTTLPEAGEVVVVTYTRTPGGQLQATTVKGSRSNGSERALVKGSKSDAYRIKPNDPSSTKACIKAGGTVFADKDGQQICTILSSIAVTCDGDPDCYDFAQSARQ